MDMCPFKDVATQRPKVRRWAMRVGSRNWKQVNDANIWVTSHDLLFTPNGGE